MLNSNNPFVRGIDQLEKILQVISQVIVLLLMLVSVANIIGRFFSYPIVGSVEVSILFMVFIIYLGLAHTQSEHGHVRVDLVLNMLRPKARKKIEMISLFICFAFLIILFWNTLLEGIKAFEIKSYLLGLISFPTWPGYLIIPFGIFFFIVRVLIHIVQAISQQRTTPKKENMSKGVTI
jgi:TRAP-type C4-dicarboxylate transport system permease small subunit